MLLRTSYWKNYKLNVIENIMLYLHNNLFPILFNFEILIIVSIYLLLKLIYCTLFNLYFCFIYANFLKEITLNDSYFETEGVCY